MGLMASSTSRSLFGSERQANALLVFALSCERVDTATNPTEKSTPCLQFCEAFIVNSSAGLHG